MDIAPFGESVHYGFLFWSSVAALVTVVAGWVLGRRLVKLPGPRQAAAEILVEQTTRACGEAFGEARARTCVPLIGTLLLLAVVSNVIGLVPIHAMTLGLFPEHGLEIGGEPFRDFDDDTVWQPGEPAVRKDVTDWDSTRRETGFLIPSPRHEVSHTSMPLSLSLGLVLTVLALFAAGRWAGMVRRIAAERRPYLVPLAALARLPSAVAGALRSASLPMGGAAVAILVGVVWYRLLVNAGVVFMPQIAAGVVEAVVLVLVRRARDRAMHPHGDATPAS